jgi:hypothetical protein
MNNSEKMRILEMVNQGEVSVEDALGMISSPEPRAAAHAPASAGRWLRVRVSDLETGTNKVSVNLPLQLMRWGLTLGSRFVPELHNVDLDDMMTDLDSAMTDLDDYAGGRLVEVEDNDAKQRVEIYIE